MPKQFLPISKSDIDDRGWDLPDIILVTGDAYVDHPSYGTSVIGRVLESAGFKVAVIAQPDWRRPDAFKQLGRPRLFFGVTAGNLDSMVANYTANKKLRKDDEYSPGGAGHLRPDRATIVYTNRIKEAFPGMPVVIGGVEASMRRLAHYDYWSEQVRRSILLDSKADILVYGMGERQILRIAERLKAGEDIKALDDVQGTVVIKNSIEKLKGYVNIPSFEEVSADTGKYNEATRKYFAESDPFIGKTIVQRHDKRFVIQLPPALPLSTNEMDRIYGLTFARTWHPIYDREGGVPGFETVRFSIISHRGCPGSCNFCSLYLHQGRIVQSRSIISIIREAEELTHDEKFGGTITDIGGPTANLYMSKCEKWQRSGACRAKQCLMPAKCDQLKLGYTQTTDLWKRIMAIPKIKHLFIGSGIRYDLLIDRASDEYLKALCKDHVSGRLKVAPEHTNPAVLKLMNKPQFDLYRDFTMRYNYMNINAGKKQFLVNYFISGHPGSTLEDALEMALELAKHHIHPEQIQDFIPLPMTVSNAMYYTEKDPFTGKGIFVAKGLRERKLHRALAQYKQPKNRRYVIEALRKLKKMKLMAILH